MVEQVEYLTSCWRLHLRWSGRHPRRRFVAGVVVIPIDVKDLAQVVRHRAVVGVDRHQVTHVPPPLPADIRRRNRLPLRVVVHLDIPKQVPRVGGDEDGIRSHAMIEQDAFEVGPDGPVTAFVLVLGPGVDDKEGT